MTADPWESHAEWWKTTFTGGVDAEYTDQILPLVNQHLAGCRHVLDAGTGEGQLARAAARIGAERVVGIDTAVAQLSNARSHVDAGPAYARADVSALPFPDASFDAVISCLVLQHIAEPDGALAESSRVLRLGGRLLLFLNHPLMQTPGSGWIDDHILHEQYFRVGRYLVEETTIEEIDKDVFLPFVHRPLSHYVRVMAAAGLHIVDIEEPAPPAEFIAELAQYRDAATIPRLMFICAERVA